MANFIQNFCDNFLKLKSKNESIKLINFDRNESEASFFGANELLVVLTYQNKNDISRFYKYLF